MTFVLGVDPGATGAFAVYDTGLKRLATVTDMPTWFQTVGKKKRKRVDALAVADLFDAYEVLGVSLVVMEAVGGRPKQGASAAFVFGYGVGLIYMAALYSRIAIETVPPGAWKKIMNVPGKSNGGDDDILNRADEIFPQDRHWFRTERGGKRVDRAEAAMLAKFGADHVLHTLGQLADPELRMIYRNADTGA